MAKRKRAQEASVEVVDLTSLSDGLVETNQAANGIAPPSKKQRVEKAKDVVKEAPEATQAGKKGKVKGKSLETSEIETNGEVVKTHVKRKRKTKEEKEAEAMPLAARTVGHKLFIGAHVSAAGGVHNSVPNSVHIGANAFALFLKSQRKWTNPPLVNEHCTSFHANCKSHLYDQMKHVVPHGSYLVNLAHTDEDRTKQAYEAFLDDLKRCERLGITLYNFHPGVANSTGGDRPAAIAHLASNINRAHKDTKTVVLLLENMAAGGNVLGSTFEDLRDIIALVHKKERVGVCIDTCHAFAGGYDLCTPAAFKATMVQFEDVVGFKYLRAVHMNDSKAPLASHRDLHANIGTGFLGLRAFHNIVNDPRFEGLPIILETPLNASDENGVLLADDKGKAMSDDGIWAREIKLLESLVGMDPDGKQFLKLEKALANKGATQRKKATEQMEKKREKQEKKEKGKKKKGKGNKKESEDEDSSLSDDEE